MVRNITGGQQLKGVENIDTYASGAFSVKDYSDYGRGHLNNGPSVEFDFDASRVVDTSKENRPINIALLPVIAF